ncbi:MAG: YbgA family protein [Thermotogota bacterium]
MRKFSKPKVIISRCIEFEKCRYNEGMISSEAVKMMKPFVDFITVCPEADIGMGVPRIPVRIVEEENGIKLKQLKTGKDWTQKMVSYREKISENIDDDIDGFILKSRSPSCGPYEVKIYKDIEKGAPLSNKGNGFFGGYMKGEYKNLPVEDEGRLTNFTIRDHFLTTVFALADFREMKEKNSLKNLIYFHSRYKFLILSYDEKNLRKMGKLVANNQGKSEIQIIEEYEDLFKDTFKNIPKPTNAINVLMHIMGYFKDKLKPTEKQFYLNILDSYKEGKLPLSTPLYIAKEWVIKYENEYLDRQVFFERYPQELVTISDSGKGRNL